MVPMPAAPKGADWGLHWLIASLHCTMGQINVRSSQENPRGTVFTVRLASIKAGLKLGIIDLMLKKNWIILLLAFLPLVGGIFAVHPCPMGLESCSDSGLQN